MAFRCAECGRFSALSRLSKDLTLRGKMAAVGACQMPTKARSHLPPHVQGKRWWGVAARERVKNMMRLLIIVFVTIVLMASWIATVFVGLSEGWGKSAIVASDEPADFVRAVGDVVEAEHAGNFSMIVLEGGQVAAQLHASAGEAVDSETVFQVASLGKWITAWGVMVLVEDGSLDLDRPVEDYLTRWQLPHTEFDNSAVTVRHLLSHTSGLGDGLGYDGFASAAEVQSLEASLTRALDASPGNDGVVQLTAEPGSAWNYSGGGYTLLQLVIEEVSGQPFGAFMDERVFSPLGLERTTFDHREAEALGLADNYDLMGQTEPFRWYTALAATSLFTSSGDLARFIAAQTGGAPQPVLSGETLELMRTPHASQMGADIWGLGPMLYAPNNQGDFIIGHDGNNGPAINTVARFDPSTGDGLVILSTGGEMIATRLAGEWVFWKTGNIDALLFVMGFERMLIWAAGGALVILLFGIGLAFRRR